MYMYFLQDFTVFRLLSALDKHWHVHTVHVTIWTDFDLAVIKGGENSEQIFSIYSKPNTWLTKQHKHLRELTFERTGKIIYIYIYLFIYLFNFCMYMYLYQ